MKQFPFRNKAEEKYSVEVFQSLYLLLNCKPSKALFAHKMPPSVRSFPSSVPTAVKHFIFSATILLSLPRSSGVQTPAYTHSGIQGWLIPFIASVFSVDLGMWKWNKGAWLCGWRSREQALFVNRAPCCCAECSRGESAAFCAAPSAHLAPEGPVWAQGRGKSIARKRSSVERGQALPSMFSMGGRVGRPLSR